MKYTLLIFASLLFLSVHAQVDVIFSFGTSYLTNKPSNVSVDMKTNASIGLGYNAPIGRRWYFWPQIGVSSTYYSMDGYFSTVDGHPHFGQVPDNYKLSNLILRNTDSPIRKSFQFPNFTPNC